jgi:hypothetical protein
VTPNPQTYTGSRRFTETGHTPFINVIFISVIAQKLNGSGCSPNDFVDASSPGFIQPIPVNELVLN